MSRPSLPFVSCFRFQESLVPGSSKGDAWGGFTDPLGCAGDSPEPAVPPCPAVCAVRLLLHRSTPSQNLTDTSRQIKVWGQQEQRDNPGQSLGLEPAPAMSLTPLPHLLGGGCCLYFAAALAFPVQKPSNIPCPLLPCWSSPCPGSCPALVLFQDPKSQKLTASLPPASPIIFFSHSCCPQLNYGPLFP